MRGLAARWRGLPADERGRLHGLAVCAALYLVHTVTLSTWLIEDAAITFAYARHLAEGEGFVAWPGGERVEGFSNPSWTLLLAAAHRLGANPFVASKLLGALCGVATLGFAYVWARRLAGASGPLPVLAPLLLALSPQFVIWNASGLENALLNLCLAACCALAPREARTGSAPWSGLPLGVLAITRPEAPLYCAIVAAAAALVALRSRGAAAWRWIAALGVVSLAPLVLWEAFSWWYFAWPFPNTFYAKARTMERFRLFGWDGAAWTYVRGWALRSGWGLLLPLAGPLLLGLRGRRRSAGLAVGAAVVCLLLPGLGALRTLGWTEPTVLVQVRVIALALAAALLPLGGLGRPGQADRSLAWYLVVATVGFALYAGGDWMDGWRWFATAQVPLAVLLPDLLARVAEAQPRWRRAAVGLLAAPLLLCGVTFTGQFLSDVETAPYSVYQRVRWMHLAQQRLHLDHVVNMDVDFGAQMWWTGHELVDLAGLNDVAIAHHAWEDAFVREYVFEERRPDFVHAHGSWKTHAGLHRQPAFRSEYVEIPGYPVSRERLHIGNHVRRDLLVRPSWEDADGREADFGPVRLEGLDVPAPLVAPGEALYVEVGWRPGQRRGVPFRPVLFLTDGARVHAWEIPPGYDWLPAHGWRASEILFGRYTLTLPADLPVGRHDLGLAVFGPDGAVLPAREAAEDPRFARGEVRWRGAVEVAPPDRVRARVAEGRAEVLRALEGGRCAEADADLQRIRRHLAPDGPDAPATRPEVIAGFARCWARHAEAAEDGATAEDAIRRARRWDHRHPEVARVGRALADRWEASGRAALAAGDDEGAYRHWRRALVADPTRSRLQREVEALRDRRLGLAPEEEG